MNSYERIYSLLIEQGQTKAGGTRIRRGVLLRRAQKPPTIRRKVRGAVYSATALGAPYQETLRKAVSTGGSEMYRTPRSLASQPKEALYKPKMRAQGVGLDIKA